MRVKLFYTVEEEDVFKEAAKLISLSGDDLQQAVNLFTAVQKELTAPDEDTVVNIDNCQEMISEFRQALMQLDMRLAEVGDIVAGYAKYKRGGDPSQEEVGALEGTAPHGGDWMDGLPEAE